MTAMITIIFTVQIVLNAPYDSPAKNYSRELWTRLSIFFCNVPSEDEHVNFLLRPLSLFVVIGIQLKINPFTAMLASSHSENRQ